MKPTTELPEELTRQMQSRQQIEIGQQMMNLREFQKAADRFRKALEIFPEGADAQAELARALSALGKNKDALRAVETALEKEPQNAYFLYLKGFLLADLIQFGKAKKLFEEAIALAPQQAIYHEALASVIFRWRASESHLGYKKPLREAEAHVRHALTLNPNHVASHLTLAQILHTLGEEENAREHYQKALQINPENAYAHKLAGIHYANSREPEKAIEHFQIALQINPNDKGAQHGLHNAKFYAKIFRLTRAVHKQRIWLWNLFFGRLPHILRVPAAFALMILIVLAQDFIQHFPVEKWRSYHEIFIKLLLAYILLVFAGFADWFSKPPKESKNKWQPKSKKANKNLSSTHKKTE